MEKLLEEIRDWGDGYFFVFMVLPGASILSMLGAAFGGIPIHGFMWWTIPVLITGAYYLFALTSVLGYGLYLGEEKDRFRTEARKSFQYFKGSVIVIGFFLTLISLLLCSWVMHWLIGLTLTLCLGIIGSFILAKVFLKKEVSND